MHALFALALLAQVQAAPVAQMGCPAGTRAFTAETHTFCVPTDPRAPLRVEVYYEYVAGSDGPLVRETFQEYNGGALQIVELYQAPVPTDCHCDR